MTKTVPYDGLYCDDRMVGDPKYYLGGKPVNADMRIPDEYLESVCFVCVKVPLENGQHRIEFAGTGLLSASRLSRDCMNRVSVGL